MAAGLEGYGPAARQKWGEGSPVREAVAAPAAAAAAGRGGAKAAGLLPRGQAQSCARLWAAARGLSVQAVPVGGPACSREPPARFAGSSSRERNVCDCQRRLARREGAGMARATAQRAHRRAGAAGSARTSLLVRSFAGWAPRGPRWRARRSGRLFSQGDDDLGHAAVLPWCELRGQESQRAPPRPMRRACCAARQ